MRIAISFLVASTALTAPAWAAPILFSDQRTEQILFAHDSNRDGDANDTGEVTVFFDGTNASGLTMPSNNVQNLVQTPTGDVFAADSASRTVYRLRDMNGNNTAQDAGEASVWFSADNADGLPLQVSNGLAQGGDGAIYVVQADTIGTPTQDVVYRTQDLNGDGDANDAGEATVWLDLGALNAGSSPFEIAFDGDVAYIADTAGGRPRMYRAEDRNGDGVIGASEVGQFLQTADFFFALSAEVSDGKVFSYDIFTDQIAGFDDVNGDGKIDFSVEKFTAWDAAGFVDGAVFDFTIMGDKGIVTVNDFDDDDTLLSLMDLNGDGDFLDAGETTTFLQFSQQGRVPERPRSVLFYDVVAPAPVPLPASSALLMGALGVLLIGWRKNRAAA